MIKFTDKRLYLKGTSEAYAYDKVTDDIIYYSNKFQTGNVQTSVTMGEIRAGVGNPVAAIIPSDATLTVEFTAADFNLWAKAAQVGGTLDYNAPVTVCETITASGSSLTLAMTEGTPVEALGSSNIVCYVFETGAPAPISTYGTAYALDPSTGAISDFVATIGKTYKVFYTVKKASARIATIESIIDPKVVRFEAYMPVYANEGGTAGNEGTKVGTLKVIVPSLKLGGNGGITGDQTNNDTTSMSGQAVSYDEDVISDTCEGCGADGSVLAYYIYEPCDETEAILGLVLVGGVITLETNSSAKADFKLAMEDGSLVTPDPANMAYSMTTAITGVSVSSDGVITSGGTAGDGEVTATYTLGADTYTCVANVSVVSA